jgi:hypothetical protein
MSTLHTQLLIFQLEHTLCSVFNGKPFCFNFLKNLIGTLLYCANTVRPPVFARSDRKPTGKIFVEKHIFFLINPASTFEINILQKFHSRIILITVFFAFILPIRAINRCIKNAEFFGFGLLFFQKTSRQTFSDLATVETTQIIEGCHVIFLNS